ncbi:Hypothetical protein HVR_LOCUS953 [uncultured virus]|nr:Hypothetical protein HVR_LOCUS953 [uncultured virus]
MSGYQCIQYGDDVSYCEELVGIISEEEYDKKALCLKIQCLTQARCPSCRDTNARITDDPNGGPPSWADRILPCDYHYKHNWGTKAVKRMVENAPKDTDPVMKMIENGQLPEDDDSLIKMLDVFASTYPKM